MRKILENTITILAELLILVLCIIWYIKDKEIEPLVGIVASSAALLASLIARFFPAPVEEAPSTPVKVKVSSKEKTNAIEKSKIKADSVIVGSNSTIDNRTIIYENGHEIPRIISPKSPLYPRYFIGRGKKLKEVHKRLFKDDDFLLLVNGNGGMGKTTLASRYFFDYEKD